jgi:hypothetical protein
MSFTQSNPIVITAAESTPIERLIAALRFLPTLLSAAVLAGVAVVALWPVPPQPDSTPARRPSMAVTVPLEMAPEAAPARDVVLLLVDGPAEAAAIAAGSAVEGREVVIVDTSVVSEASLVETMRELLLLEVPFELVDLRAP